MIITPMLELPHVLVGAAIATAVRNPVLALPLALSSHLLLDEIPHWNPHISTELKTRHYLSASSILIIIVDSLLALTIGLVISARALPDTGQFINILACCLLGALPDLLEAPHFFFHLRISVIEKLVHFQKRHQHNSPPLLGLLTQTLVIAASLLVIFSLK